MSTPGDGGPPSGGPEGGAPDGGGPAVKDRWWVDTGDKKRERSAPVAPAAPAPVVGGRFYRSAIGFEQEAARSRLTDNNVKLLMAANPLDGTWGYVQLAEKPHNEQNRESLVAQMALGPYARGVVVDCGRTLRFIVSGEPLGQRLIDFTLGDTPSLDIYIEGEWVRERVFREQRGALSAFRRAVVDFLSPEGIAAWDAIRAQV